MCICMCIYRERGIHVYIYIYIYMVAHEVEHESVRGEDHPSRGGANQTHLRTLPRSREGRTWLKATGRSEKWLPAMVWWISGGFRNPLLGTTQGTPNPTFTSIESELSEEVIHHHISQADRLRHIFGSVVPNSSHQRSRSHRY